ncbi:MAG: adenylate/guanylate cyclase domain-containing protein [Candidatus Odyssella sp.]|nr:adenylate/guanylate cyclase domain-containing protein [Candidatus Odyssella sp.]
MDGAPANLPDVNRDYDAALAAFTAWYVHEAPRIRSARELVRRTCERFVAHGVPLRRFTALLLMLHPDYFGISQRWSRGSDEVKTSRGSYEIWNRPILQDSPYGEINRGAAALRRRLAGPHARIDYDVLREYAAEGCTDYVIMHLPFGDEGRHAAAFATDRPGGFTPAELRLIDAMLPHMARQSELLTLRYLTTTLLDTYVGRNAGERVLTGQIRRGSGETIRAVIWFSDLRGFTPLSDRLPRDTLIALLNGYFDCVGGAIAAAGGEILKFIGDAVLAIFPLGTGRGPAEAAQAALGAAQAARAGLAALRALPGGDGLDFGVALHAGDVMYGNIGTAQRLDFTVIGPAVNATARLQSLASTLGEPILVSAEIAAAVGAANLESVGRHALKGLAEPVEAFRPAPSK